MTLVIADFLKVKTDLVLIQMAANHLIIRAISVFPILPHRLRVITATRPTKKRLKGLLNHLYEPSASSRGESVEGYDSEDLSQLSNTDW